MFEINKLRINITSVSKISVFLIQHLLFLLFITYVFDAFINSLLNFATYVRDAENQTLPTQNGGEALNDLKFVKFGHHQFQTVCSTFIKIVSK